MGNLQNTLDNSHWKSEKNKIQGWGISGGKLNDMKSFDLQFWKLNSLVTNFNISKDDL